MKTPIQLDASGRHGPQELDHCRGLWSVTLVAASLCWLWLANAPAATVVLQQGVNGFTGDSDAWLDESLKTRNYGGSIYVQAQYNNGVSDCALLRFPLPTLSFESLTTATLGLYYYDQSSMQANNALTLTPYRIKPAMGWFENNYDGAAGYGVSWRYRDAAETLVWTSEYGAWYDKLDDGNSSAKIKRVGGSVPDAIAPPAWITWNVRNSVAQWYAGQENNGFVLFESGFEGNGYIAAGLFYSREFGTANLRPYLSLGYSGARIAWAGQAGATWDTSAVNWTVGGYRGSFGNGDHVTFGDGASNPLITVGGGVSPGSITVSNTSTTYGFSGGSLGGSGGLVKTGSGSATLLASNSFTGLTTVKAGTLVVAADNALGSPSSGTIVSNGASLVFSDGVNYTTAEPLTISGAGVGGNGAVFAVIGSNTFAGEITLAADCTTQLGSGTTLALAGGISGGFSFTKNGPGTLVFCGVAGNAYGGSTFVNQGTLLVNNDPDHGWGAGPGPVVVNSGALLGGRGSIWGTVTVSPDGTLNPGASIGTLVISNRVRFQPGSRYQVEVASAPLTPEIDALDLRKGGELTLEEGARLELQGTLTGGDPFVIVRNATGISGQFDGLPEGAALAPPNAAWFIHYRAHAVYLGRNPQPLRYFRAFSTNGVVLAGWRTAIELDTVGFNLFRWEETGWVRINAAPIPPQNPNGAAYLLVDAGGVSGQACRYRLDEQTLTGTESWEFARTPTEFAFSAPPRPVEGGVELRWLSRVDETYSLLGTPDLNLPMKPLQQDLPATPPECVVTNRTHNPQGYYWLRSVP